VNANKSLENIYGGLNLKIKKLIWNYLFYWTIYPFLWNKLLDLSPIEQWSSFVLCEYSYQSIYISYLITLGWLGLGQRSSLIWVLHVPGLCELLRVAETLLRNFISKWWQESKPLRRVKEFSAWCLHKTWRCEKNWHKKINEKKAQN